MLLDKGTAKNEFKFIKILLSAFSYPYATKRNGTDCCNMMFSKALCDTSTTRVQLSWRERNNFSIWHKNLSHLTMITWHIIERERACLWIWRLKGPGLSPPYRHGMSHVGHLWTSEVRETTSSWHPSETAKPVTDTLALESPLCPCLQNGSNDISLFYQDVHVWREAQEAEVFRHYWGWPR